jgi:hypothetical protein
MLCMACIGSCVIFILRCFAHLNMSTFFQLITGVMGVCGLCSFNLTCRLKTLNIKTVSPKVRHIARDTASMKNYSFKLC